jgi:hypothetical protein
MQMVAILSFMYDILLLDASILGIIIIFEPFHTFYNRMWGAMKQEKSSRI